MKVKTLCNIGLDRLAGTNLTPAEAVEGSEIEVAEAVGRSLVADNCAVEIEPPVVKTVKVELVAPAPAVELKAVPPEPEIKAGPKLKRK